MQTHSSPEISRLRRRQTSAAVACALSLPLLLAACNESASNKLATGSIVLNGELLVDGSNVRMTTALGKEGSSVVVVLEGGDVLRAGNGSSDIYMDYTSGIFGAHYRASFPLNMAATYSATLTRADGSSTRSEFPALPNAFMITSPLNAQTFSLAVTPLVDIAWDVVVASNELALDTTLGCSWNVAPLPAGTFGPFVERSSGDYRVLNSGERSARRATVHVAAMATAQRARLQLDNPGATVTLHACDAAFRLYAKNYGPAHNALSRQSQMNTRRTAETAADILP
jgi:hypothetical protein